MSAINSSSSSDFSLADVREHICDRYGLTRGMLDILDFPSPTYRRGMAHAPFWTQDTLRPWLEAFHLQQLATRPAELAEVTQVAIALRRLAAPHEPEEVAREIGLKVWVRVRTDTCLSRGPFKRGGWE